MKLNKLIKPKQTKKFIDEKIIILDFDGTIANSIPVMIEIYNKHLAGKYKLNKIKEFKPLRDVDLRGLIKMSGLNFFKMIFFIREARRDFKLGIKKVKLIPGIKKTIQTLSKKYRLGILSSNEIDNIAYFLKKNNMDQYFDFIASEKALFSKDRALKKIMKKHKFNPKNVIYIGDELRDLVAAKKAEVAIISVTWGHNSEKLLKQNNPSCVAKKPKDIELFAKKYFKK